MKNKNNFVQVVPWRNKTEWLEVYQKLYSNHHDDVEMAISKVAVWQARCPTVAILGVEATVGLIRARFQDQNYMISEVSALTKTELSMTYAMAIVRFVNLVCEVGHSTAHVTSIRSIAARMGIPEWLVNMRHSATHRYSIPSLDMLRTGASVALQWLKFHYWERESNNIQDFIPEQTMQNIGTAGDQIRSCIREFQEVEYTHLYMHKEKDKASLKRNRTVLQGIVNNLRTIFKAHSYEFVQVLSESGHLVPKYHHLETLLKPGEADFLDSDSVVLPLSLMKFWAPVISLFSNNDHLSCLLKLLLEPRSVDNDFENRISIAWVLNILDGITSEHWTLFQFQPQLNWIELYKVALKNPSKYSLPILSIISENINISEDVKQTLMAMVSLYLGNVTSSNITKKISNTFTLQDLEKELPLRRDASLQKSGPWKKYTKKIEWQKMPIGCIIQVTKRGTVLGKEHDGESEVKANERKVVAVEGLENFEPMIVEESSGCEEEEVEAEPTDFKVTDLSSALLIF